MVRSRTTKTRIVQLVITKKSKRYELMGQDEKEIKYKLDKSREELEKELPRFIRQLKEVKIG